MATIARALRSRSGVSVLLIAPLAAFLITFYVLPIALFLYRGVDTGEITRIVPRTAAALTAWEGSGLPDDAAFAALAADLRASEQGAAILARRLNAIEPGLRTTVRKAAAAARGLDGAAPEAARPRLVEADPFWGRTEAWQLLKRETRLLTPTFLLDAVDLRQDADGLRFETGSAAFFLPIFARTLAISLAVTAACVVIGYPVAWVIATASPRVAAWLMLMVLVPFWLSILARTAAWVIVLQGSGPINTFLRWVGLIETPLALIFNRFGVVLVMVHVMLPFLVLPLYTSIRAIPRSYFHAAANLGAPPASAFRHVILPLTLPGLWAGGFIVFIMSIGYYITPALVGGPNDQMISSFIAFYTNQSVNWSLAAALSAWLLAGMLIVVAVSQRLVGPMIKKVT